MRCFARFGSVLVLVGALAAPASGCAATSPEPHHVAVTAQQVAIKTVTAHVKPLLAGSIHGFAARRQQDGEWLVTFSGNVTEATKSDPPFVAFCQAHPGGKTTAPEETAGRQMVSADGEALIGQLMLYRNGTMVPVACPPS